MPDWVDLLKEHGPLVWKTVYRIVGRHADASDCFQEAFVRALQFARRQEVRNWPGLLRRLATQCALDRLRQHLRRSSHERPVANGLGLADGAPGPPEQAERTELADQLRLALTKLPPRQAEVFILRQLENRSYQEIADLLAIDVNSVGVQLHRARIRLADIMQVRVHRSGGCVHAQPDE